MAIAETDGKRLQIHEADRIDTSSVTSLLATLTPQATVTVDAVNKRLLVVASEQDQVKVTEVLEQVRTTDAASNRVAEVVSAAAKNKFDDHRHIAHRFGSQSQRDAGRSQSSIADHSD